MTDKELIAGCLKNDRRSQNELYKKYYPLMTSIALRYCKGIGETKQAVNYGFFQVLQKLDRYDTEYSLATFIRTILVNHLIDEFRKKKRHISSIYIEEHKELIPKSNLSEVEAKFEEQELRHILDQLPDVTSTVFNLFAIDGYKHKEIATLLNISEGTSKWHVSEARKRLKILMADKNEIEKKTTKVSNEW